MDGVTAMARPYEPRVAKKIYLHRNGIDNDRPKTLVINERQIRDFTTFLNRATSGIRAPVAVRNIYTPQGGSKVFNLHDLENGKHYVAGGTEHFKKLKYTSIEKALTTKLQPGATKWSPMKTSYAINAVSRFRNLPEKPYLIHVFRNGDALFHGVRVLLPKRIMHSMEHILELITEKADLTLPAKRLCTLDGQTVHAITDIKDGEKYVVIEGARRFIRLPYTAIEPTHKNLRQWKMKRFGINNSEAIPPVIANTDINTSLDDTKQIKRLMPAKTHKGKSRPFAGRKDIEARNLALPDARADSVLGVIPTSVKKSSIGEGEEAKIPPEQLAPTGGNTVVAEIIDQSMNESQLTDENSIVESADQTIVDSITESNDNEKPLEAEEVNEVQEEEIDVKDSDHVMSQVQEDTAVELEGKNVHNTVDLSVARVNSTDDKEPSKPTSEASSKVTSKTQLPTESSQ